MSRKSRIDTPGALHHIIVRGIERRKVFVDDADRNTFLDRINDTISFFDTMVTKQAHILGTVFRIKIQCLFSNNF